MFDKPTPKPSRKLVSGDQFCPSSMYFDHSSDFLIRQRELRTFKPSKAAAEKEKKKGENAEPAKALPKTPELKLHKALPQFQIQSHGQPSLSALLKTVLGPFVGQHWELLPVLESQSYYCLLIQSLEFSQTLLSILNITEYFQLSSYSTKESIQKNKIKLPKF